MVLLGSLLSQFVSKFGRANLLSSFHLDVDSFISFSTRILIKRFNGLKIFILTFVSKIPKSRFMLELMIFMSILSCETRCSNLAASQAQ